MFGWLQTLTLLAVLASGLMAGLFFIFSVAIMPALARLPAANGIAAMQSINVVILNPLFLIAFMGGAVVCGALLVAAITGWTGTGATLTVIGALLYLAGMFGVTMAFNVPLNNALDKASPGTAEAAALWTRYLSVWTAWKHVRAASSVGALAAFAMALR